MTTKNKKNKIFFIALEFRKSLVLKHLSLFIYSYIHYILNRFILIWYGLAFDAMWAKLIL